MKQVGTLQLALNSRPRRWFGIALAGLSIACGILDAAGLSRGAERLSDVGTTLLARYGIKISVR